MAPLVQQVPHQFDNVTRSPKAEKGTLTSHIKASARRMRNYCRAIPRAKLHRRIAQHQAAGVLLDEFLPEGLIAQRDTTVRCRFAKRGHLYSQLIGKICTYRLRRVIASEQKQIQRATPIVPSQVSDKAALSNCTFLLLGAQFSLVELPTRCSRNFAQPRFRLLWATRAPRDKRHAEPPLHRMRKRRSFTTNHQVNSCVSHLSQ